MEITFQNKIEDAEAFSEYMAKETQQGKQIGSSVFWNRQRWSILGVAFLGALLWGTSGQWKFSLVATVAMLIFMEVLLFLISGVKPYEHEAKMVYKNQSRTTTRKEWQVFLLPRTLTFDEKWLEIRSSEALHRYRWRQVNQIGLTPDFIFIHVGTCPVVHVPKRDFPSEQSFTEFGKKLMELQEKNKEQPIGAE